MAEGGEVLKQTSCLTINVEHLLSLQGVEKQRVEFKKAWHGRGHQGGSYWQIVHTICAFANDFYNDNGGYIVIGVEEETESDADRQVKLPPFGVVPLALDRIQKEIINACRCDIKPQIIPVISAEMCQGEHILVICVRASQCGPLQARESAKGEHRFYIRKGTETTKATPEEITQLLQQHTKTPFDDRNAICSLNGKPITIKDIQWDLVTNFLDSVGSELHKQSLDKEKVYKNIDLTVRHGDIIENGELKPTYVPRNFSLLFFNSNPYGFFRGAKIEIGRYSRNDEFIEEKQLSGPIDMQIRECLSYILEQTQEEVSYACVTYPERALREAVVNAVYHRSYEPDHCDPIKVHMRPDRIEIISYPGPHPCLKPEHFMEGMKRPCVPARNRRIGNHLKQLKLAEARYTGVNTIFKTMKKNNNSPPQFEFDFSYFQVTLPSHPKYITHTLLSDIDNLIAKGEKKEAVEMLLDFVNNYHDMLSPLIVFKLIELHDGDILHPIVQKYSNELLEADKTNFEHLWNRGPLLQTLKLCLNTKPLDIEVAVQTVKALVDKGPTLEQLDFVVQEVVRICRDHFTRGKSQRVLENLQNGHKLFEAMGATILQSSGM